MIWTVLFVVAVMVLGCVLFSVHDWGRPQKPHGGIVRGKYLPRVYLRVRPIGKVNMKAYRDFHARHDVVSDREFLDAIDRS